MARAPPPRCLGELVKQPRPRTFVGGNLGPPSRRPTRSPRAERYAMHVVELSSFQLEGIVDASFQGTAILNLTPDHLDRLPDPRGVRPGEGAHLRRSRRRASRWSTPTTPTGWSKCARASGALAKYLPVYAFSMNDGLRTNPGLPGLAVGNGSKFASTSATSRASTWRTGRCAARTTCRTRWPRR